MTRDEIKKLGREAFVAGVPASESPYSFIKSEFWPKNYDGFSAVRWRLDAWMEGWIEAQRDGLK